MKVLHINHTKAAALGMYEHVANVMNETDRDAMLSVGQLMQAKAYQEAKIYRWCKVPEDIKPELLSLTYINGYRPTMPGDIIYRDHPRSMEAYWLVTKTGYLPIKFGTSLRPKHFDSDTYSEADKAAVQFNASQDLDHMLMMTDIDDVPAMFFQLPYPSTYLQFSDHPELRLEFEGIHYPVKGIYLQERAYKGRRTIIPTVLLHGDVEIPFPPLVISDPEQLLSELVYKKHGSDRLIAHTAKLLLYINSRFVREGTDAHARALRKLKVVNQVLYVLPVQPSKKPITIKLPRALHTIPMDQASSDQLMPAHYRRGHFKAVTYGPNGSLRKIKWIMPTVVNFHLLGPGMTKAVAIRQYAAKL